MSAFEARTIDGKLLEEVRLLIEQQDSASLKKLIDPMKPADVADLIEHSGRDEGLFIFRLLTPEGGGDVLMEIEAPVRERILEDLDNEAITQIVELLDSDDAADVVGDLPPDRAREVIQAVRDEVTEELERLLPYPEDTAGGIMALEFVAVKANATVGDAVESIREKREEVENLYYIWVTDDFHKLVGVISLKDLVLEPHDRQISDIMNPDVISVHVKADQEEVINLVRRYDLVNIPVVDDGYRLVGRITYDDIIEAIEDEVDEDISLMAGVIDQEITEASILKISRARLPWLVAALLGGILAAVVINQFESSLEKLIALSFFFPVVMAMGGNTGTQAALVVVRGLATGDIGLVNVGRRLWMEMRVALINGIICGIILGLIVGLWLKNYQLTLIVTIALMVVILFSGVIGSAIPLVLKRLNIDPALASGPFVTTTNDILGLLIYLGLVTAFLRVPV